MSEYKLKTGSYGSVWHSFGRSDEENSDFSTIEKEVNYLRKKVIELETVQEANEIVKAIQSKEVEEERKEARYWKNKYEDLKSEEDILEVNIIRRRGEKLKDKKQDYKYKFSWDHIGDIEKGRPNLGNKTRVEVYRLMQFTLKDILSEEYGGEEVDLAYYRAGKLAGESLYENMMSPVEDLNGFLKGLQELIFELGIGILNVEKADMDLGELILTISEDVDCSGVPYLGYELCTYDEGVIAGLIESFAGINFSVQEIDCWGTGSGLCRFHAVTID